MVHSRRIEREAGERILTFGHEGTLYKRSFVMYDQETQSKWNHSTGLCMKGPLKGKQLKILPARVTHWEHWKRLHPSTKVLLGRRNSGFMGRFMRASINSYGIAISSGMRSRLYPYRVLSLQRVLNDRFTGGDWVVVYDPSDQTAFAFDRVVDGEPLTFEAVEERAPGTPRMRDVQTGSLWDRMSGTCLEGKLEGRQLRQAITVPWLVDRWRDIYGEGGSIYSP